MSGVCDASWCAVVDSEPLVEWNYAETMGILDVDICQGHFVAGVCASGGVFVGDECFEFRCCSR